MGSLDSFPKGTGNLLVSKEEEFLQQWGVDCFLSFLVISGLGKEALPSGDVYCTPNCYVTFLVYIISFSFFPCHLHSLHSY